VNTKLLDKFQRIIWDIEAVHFVKMLSGGGKFPFSHESSAQTKVSEY
jgi:hypothetical protein